MSDAEGPSGEAAPDPTARPALRVVRGEPDAAELAALTAVLSAASGDDAAPEARDIRGGWRDPARMHRAMPLPGPNAWRSSGW